MIKGVICSLLLLITGCQSINSKVQDIPAIGFDPVFYNKSDSFLDGKVTFLVESSGTDFWLIAKNGNRSFVEIKELILAGSRCAYTTQNTFYLAPNSVSTYIIPTAGLIGLCYNNQDQIKFIEDDFSKVSTEESKNNSLPLYFISKYKFPGEVESKVKEFSQTLQLVFSKKE